MLNSLSVLYEDDRLVAVAKPSGQLVIPGRGVCGPTLREAVEAHLGAKAYVVHRLDLEASGVVVFAKDAATHRALCAAFETRKVHKIYLAWVLGAVDGDGRVAAPLAEFGSGRIGVREGGKPSRTVYRVLRRRGRDTLLEVEPETGRRHQIRVHLYSIGHPILGDSLYGKELPVGGEPRLMLHALRLRFDLAGRHYDIRCDAPSEFDP